MKKCVVVADAISIVVGKDSIVNVSEKQYELARAGLKPIEQPKEELKEEKEVIVEEKKQVRKKTK